MKGQNVRQAVLRRLSDGRFHSGQDLARDLGVTRTAVWKHVKGLEMGLGLVISAVRGRGYRLAAPMEMLDEERVRAELGGASRAFLDTLSVAQVVDSTNNCASADPPQQSRLAKVWLAEMQTEGRGRRGRQWVSTYGVNLYLSFAWRFDLAMNDLAGLSLAAGVVVAEVLQRLGMDGHALKWPNDILVDGRKLSGILVEASGESGGPATAVIGIGVNFRIPADQGRRIDQPWTDLRQVCERNVSRNRMAGMLIDGLIDACLTYENERLSPFLDRWKRFDRMRDQEVLLLRGDQVTAGIYRGIAASGALLLDEASGRREYNAGEVSLRVRGAE